MLCTALIVAVQLPDVQYWGTRRLLNRFAGNIGDKLQFSRVELSPARGLVLEDILIVDDCPYTKDEFHTGYKPIDTLLYVRSATISFALKELYSSEKDIHIRRINAKDVYVGVAIEHSGPGGDNFSRVLGSSDGKSGVFPDLGIKVDKARIQNVRVCYSSFTRHNGKYHGHGINWNDFLLTVNASVNDFQMKDGTMSGSVKADMREKCGYQLYEVKTDAQFTPGEKALFSNIEIHDPWSDIYADHYSMTYKQGKDFSDYCNKVVMDLILKPGTRLGMQSVRYYGDTMPDNLACVGIESAHMHGTVNKLSFTGVSAYEVNSGARVCAEASFLGLEKTDNTVMDLDVSSLIFTTDGLESILSDFSSTASLGLGRFAPSDRIRFRGNVCGPINDLSIDGDAHLSDGLASIDLDFHNLMDSTMAVTMAGTVETKNLDLGRISCMDKLGKCTLRTGFKANLAQGNPSIVLDSLFIDRLGVLGYDYSSIAAIGEYSGSAFDGKIVSGDPNLNFLFQGIFNLSSRTKNALYKFYANIGYADLEALNIDRRGGKSKISGQVSANYMRIVRGDDIGDIMVRALRLENSQGVSDIGNISIASHSSNNLHRIQIRSSFMDAGYVGQKPIGALIEGIQNITTRRDLPALYAKTVKTDNSSNECSFSCNMHDSRPLLSFLKPGMYIADSTKLNLNISKDGVLKGSIRSPRLALGANYLKGLTVDLSNEADALSCRVLSKEMKVSGIAFRNTAVKAEADNNTFGAGLSYDNMAGADNIGDIRIKGDISRTWDNDLSVHLHTLPSYLQFNKKKWIIEESELSYASSELQTEGVRMVCSDQSISLSGGLSANSRDTLRLDFRNIGLEMANYFSKKELGISGQASGKALLISPMQGGMGLLANASSNELSVGGVPAGAIRIAASWTEEDNKLNAIVRNIVGDGEALFSRIAYEPASGNINATASLHSFNLAPVAPFVSSYLSEIGGAVSGTFKVDGPVSHPQISSSDAQIENVNLRIRQTNVPYWISGPFRLENDSLSLENIVVKDRIDGYGNVTASLDFSNFSRLSLGASASIHNLEVLNMPASLSDGFYGNLAASGNASLNGPLDALTIDVNASTSQEGNLHVSVESGGGSSGSDLLTFKKPEVREKIDPYEAMLSKLSVKEVKTNDLRLKARINVSPDVETVVEVDKQTGNELSARGNGTVEVELRPAKDILNVTGDYTISSGKYHFATIGSLVTKDFTIQNGSSVKFGGDIMESELDVTAIYPLKASISPLLNDTTSVANRRQVDCSITIKDKISNLKVGFGIDIPDLDPTTKSMVESALNTEDKVQRQFIALLVTGSFLQDEISGVVNVSNRQYFSVVGGLMASQLNSILQKFDIPLDLDLNYQQSSTGTNIFDVGVSTQLFDNRVVASGNIGNRDYNMSNSNSEVVGNLDIEVKLDKSGQLRMTLFSHSADDYTNYLDNTQRNGVGLAYQKEFSKFSDFFKGLFASKEKKAKMLLEQELRDREQITIKAE